MPQLTKQQVITRWVVGAVIGIVLTVLMFNMGNFEQVDQTQQIVYYVLMVLAPVLIAWQVFSLSICWKDFLKYTFTLHLIKGFIAYVKGYYYAVKATIVAFTEE